MKTVIAISVMTVLACLSAVAQAAPIKAYRSEQAAQKHCPDDVVVYGENKSGGVYHLKGTRYYGHLKDGSYACRKEADAGGWRAAANNQ